MNYAVQARKAPPVPEVKKPPVHPDAQGLQLAKCQDCSQKLQLIWRDPVSKTQLIFPEHTFMRIDGVPVKCAGTGKLPNSMR